MALARGGHEKRPPRTILEMSRDATNYARSAFASTPMPFLPPPPAEGPWPAADAIMAALVTAWAAGYEARSMERSR